MALFNFWNKKSVAIQEFESPKTNSDQTFKAAAKSLKFKKELYGDRENFEYPNMTLYEISRAVAADSYIAQSLNKYKEKIFKAGYYLKGETEPIDYLNKRLSLISFMNETIFDVLLQEIADDFITYQNAYLLKLRVDEVPFVKATPFSGEKIIGGYMRLDPCSVVIVKDKFNNITRYELEQTGGYENIKINKQDIVHFYMNRKGEDKQGTPRLEPVLEDVKALRDIEGDVLTLIHRFCFPMYHVKVGIAQAGYQGTQADIDDLRSEIENMTEDGMLLTNEKVDVKTIGAEGNALDMKDYLSYFEKRIFSGLNTSDAQMGRDANNTPDSLEVQIHDSVKHIQRHIALFAEHYIFNELLLEGGYNPILEEDERVHMIFNEISLDTRVKLENHEALKYQSNIQTLTETRAAIGKSIEVDESDLFVDNVTNYTAGVQTEQKTEGTIELAKVNSDLAIKQQKVEQATTTTTTSTSATTNKNKVPDKDNKAQKKSNAVTNNNRPQNQHGTYSVKIKESLEKAAKSQNSFEDLLSECYKLYSTFENKDAKPLEKAQTKLTQTAFKAVKMGLGDAEVYAMAALEEDLTTLESLYFDKVQKAFETLFKELNDSNLDLKAYRVKFIVHYWHKKYFWHCVCLIQKQKNVKTLDIEFSKPEEKKDRKQQIDLELISPHSLNEIESLPPFHPFCNSKLLIKNSDIYPNRKEKSRV